MNAIFKLTEEFDEFTMEFLLRVHNIKLHEGIKINDKVQLLPSQIANEPINLYGTPWASNDFHIDLQTGDLNYLLNPTADLDPRYRIPDGYGNICANIYTPYEYVIVDKIPNVTNNIQYDLWRALLNDKYIDNDYDTVMYLQVPARHAEFVKALVYFFYLKDRYQMPADDYESYSFDCDGSVIRVRMNSLSSKNAYEFQSIDDMVHVFHKLDAKQKCLLFYQTVSMKVNDNKYEYVNIPYFNSNCYLTELINVVSRLNNKTEYLNRMINLPTDEDDDCTLASDCYNELEGEECEMD